jgi:predicted DNA-binding transcriptional regulator AlpA
VVGSRRSLSNGSKMIVTTDDLPPTGFVRLKAFVGRGKPIPMAASSWWAGVATGRYPKPVKLGPRITAWRVEDIRALIEQLGARR